MNAATRLSAPGFPEEEVRRRARLGSAAGFPPPADYGATLLGAATAGPAGDALEAAHLVPPVFMPLRLEKLVDLGREPTHQDVCLQTTVGGFRSRLPLYVSAFGSTAAGSQLGLAVSRQAGELGIPMVIGENVVPMAGYGRLGPPEQGSMLARLRAYAEAAPAGFGGVAVQQSTEDADAEVWNLVYSDPAAHELLASGRLAFELKVGQGAKPGLGGMTVLDPGAASALAGRYHLEPVFGPGGHVLRMATPGTYTEEILRQQVRLMRNNFPEARVWVKLHPARDLAAAATTAWDAGADAVVVDGAEAGTGWAPLPAFGQVGLPLAECLRRLAGCLPAGQRPPHATGPSQCLLVSGRVWEGTRVVKCLALGAAAAGLGRAALLAADEDGGAGLVRLVECIAAELRLLVSALGKYRPAQVDRHDLWWPGLEPPDAPGPDNGAAGPDREPAPAAGTVAAGRSAALVRRLYELVDAGDTSGLAGLFAPDAVYHRPGLPPLAGAAAIEHFYRHDWVTREGRHSLEHLVAAGPDVAVRGLFSGVLRDGRRQEHRFAELFALNADGLIGRRDTFFHVPLV